MDRTSQWNRIHGNQSCGYAAVKVKLMELHTHTTKKKNYHRPKATFTSHDSMMSYPKY